MSEKTGRHSKGPACARDVGGDSRHVKHRLKDCRSMRCESCDKLQYLTPGRCTRATMPRCRHCGGFLVDTAAVESRKDPKVDMYIHRAERRCEQCNAVLSIRNTGRFCRPCAGR